MANEAKPKVIKYYYSKSANHMLAGFIPEEYYTNGKRKHGDIALKFSNHWYITDDPKKQKFIENRECFGESDAAMIREMTPDAFMAITGKMAQQIMPAVSTA